MTGRQQWVSVDLHGLGAGGKSPGSLNSRINPFHSEGKPTDNITRSAARAIYYHFARLYCGFRKVKVRIRLDNSYAIYYCNLNIIITGTKYF